MKPLEVSFNSHPSPDYTKLIPSSIILQCVQLCSCVYDLNHPEIRDNYHSAEQFIFDREAGEGDSGSIAWLCDILKLEPKHLIDTIAAGLPPELISMARGGITDHNKAAKFIIKLRHYLLYGKIMPDEQMPI